MEKMANEGPSLRLLTQQYEGSQAFPFWGGRSLRHEGSNSCTTTPSLLIHARLLLCIYCSLPFFLLNHPVFPTQFGSSSSHRVYICATNSNHTSHSQNITMARSGQIIALSALASAVLLVNVKPEYSLKASYLWTFLTLYFVQFFARSTWSWYIYPNFFSPIRHLPEPKVGPSAPMGDSKYH